MVVQARRSGFGPPSGFASGFGAGGSTVDGAELIKVRSTATPPFCSVVLVYERELTETVISFAPIITDLRVGAFAIRPTVSWVV